LLRNPYFNTGAVIKLCAVCCLFVVFGCKTKKRLVPKKAVADTTIKAADTKALKLNAIRAAQTIFSTFSGKARAKLNINGETNDVTLNIRIQHDQKIWISITAIAGIEVARALITPDSIFLINRLQSVYVKQPFSYINKIAGDQVNYKTLEPLFIGNAIPALLNENADLKTDSGVTRLSGDLPDVAFKVMLGADLKVTQTSMSNQMAGQSLEVVNSTFVQAGNKVVPSQIDMSSIAKEKKIQLNLRYIKEDFDQPIDCPFSIPARYKPME
jgi:hypothetical protein